MNTSTRSETSSPAISSDGISVTISGLSRDPITSFHLKSGVFYELAPLRRISGNLAVLLERNSGGWILDAGANIGNHTLYLAGRFPGSKVVSFEMNPVTFAYLEENVARSGFKNVLCRNYGLSSSSGFCGIRQNRDNPLGGAQIDTSALSGDVTLVSVDEYFSSWPEMGRCLLMKVDVEGHELQMLKGAEKFIDEHQPMIYVELKEISEFNSVTALLRTHGYRVAYAEKGALPNFMFVHSRDFEILFDKDAVLNELEYLALRIVEAWQLHRRIKVLTAVPQVANDTQ